jgi:microcystin degradation protein MlrC
MARSLRILAGGIMHETNSFTPAATTYDHFRFSRGPERYTDDAGSLAPLDAIDLVPTFVAGALPGGLVERTAYERLKAELLAELTAALPADGLLLDLHGAMEVEGIGDGETDLLHAVRSLVGEKMPIAVSLDLHGNISPELVAGAGILTAYRTAPHRDERATRRRALQLLVQALKEGLRPVSAMVKLPLLLPGEAAVTDAEPARSLYAQLAGIAQMPGVLDASLLIGCAWTDSPYATVSAIVVAEADAALAQHEATRLAASVWEHRDQFGVAVEALDVDAAIDAALASPIHPVYISDSGDNVTAGAPGDSPLIAARLVAAGASGTLVAGIVDPAAVQSCATAGVGATVQLRVGAALDARSGPPLVAKAIVERVSGEPTAQSAASAVVRIGGVRLILTSERRSFTERATIAAAGVDAAAHQVIVVKLGYLFPDLAAHARRAILALSPGATSLRLETLPYRQLPRPVFPLERETVWREVF